MFHDLRYAARVLLKDRGWTCMIVLSLALGIGANTALFTAINGLLLQKLSVSDPDTLVRFRYGASDEMATNRTDYGNQGIQNGMPVRATFSYSIYQALRANNQTLTDLFACAPLTSAVAVVDGEAEIATAFVASGNYHGVLGAKTALGRTITIEDDQPAAPPVAVISHGYWIRRFGSDPAAIGKIIRVNNVPVTIVGVLAPGLSGVQRVLASAPDISLPLALEPQLSDDQRISRPTYWWLQIMGRRKPGVTTEQVLGNFQGVFQETARQNMQAHIASVSAEDRALIGTRTRVPQLAVSSGAHGIYDAVPQNLQTITILTIVVALLLLIVCANVANLLLSRGAARVKEIAVRLSMGATRARIIRQLLTESILLASIGGVFGLLIAAWGKELLPGSTAQAELDWRVLLFTGGLAIVTGVLFGLAPAVRATRTDLNSSLKESGRGITSARTRLGKVLVVVQIALSFVLLFGAGLFLETVQNLRKVDIGFNAENLVLFRVNPRLNQYDEERSNLLYRRLGEELKRLPGVRAVTFSSAALLSGSESDTDLVVEGRPFVRGPHNNIYELNVGPDFFETMEMPIVMGRTFSAQDTENSPKVVIINEAAVRQFFPNENPIGARVGTDPNKASEFEIVGVIRDAIYNRLREPAPPTMYFFHIQRPSFVPSVTFEVRTAGNPRDAMPAIRDVVRKVDAGLPVLAMTTQADAIEARFSQERIFAQAYALFGGIALLLASIGLFGLMSYNVVRRIHEIGIRLAVGAQRADVLAMVMRESFIMVGIGLAVGLVAALAAGRLIATLLFGLAPADPWIIIVVTSVMIGVSALASYLPARRASLVDPLIALRHE